MDYRELRTVKQLAQEAPFLTENKLRWWIFHAESNGIGSALVKVSGRVYIDRNEFNRWLEGQRLAPLGVSKGWTLEEATNRITTSGTEAYWLAGGRNDWPSDHSGDDASGFDFH